MLKIFWSYFAAFNIAANSINYKAIHRKHFQLLPGPFSGTLLLSLNTTFLAKKKLYLSHTLIISGKSIFSHIIFHLKEFFVISWCFVSFALHTYPYTVTLLPQRLFSTFLALAIVINDSCFLTSFQIFPKLQQKHDKGVDLF